MKQANLIPGIKNIFLTVAAGIMIFSFSECTAQKEFLSSSIVPAARGTVSVKRDKFNNYIIKLKITNLAEATRLSPPKNTYVVWMVTDENLTRNLGQVRTSSSMFSKKLNLNFETKTVFRPVRIFITAENDAVVQFPNSETILTTDDLNAPKRK